MNHTAVKQQFFFSIVLILSLLSGCSKDSGPAAVSAGAGTGGSTARFTIANDALYLIGDKGTYGSSTLQSYDISRSDDPKPRVLLNLGYGVETLFPYRQNLFIGTQQGVYIYDIARPDAPQRVSVYSHIVSCDPVVAQGNLAFATLRGGSTCRGNAPNTLDVIDFSNLLNPKLLKSYPMKNPYGLGVDGNLLFVCEGDFGLKVLDITDPMNVKQLQFIENVRTYDVIPNRKVLIVTGKDGIYQYSYADPTALTLLSRIDLN